MAPKKGSKKRGKAKAKPAAARRRPDSSEDDDGGLVWRACLEAQAHVFET